MLDYGRRFGFYSATTSIDPGAKIPAAVRPLCGSVLFRQGEGGQGGA